MRRKVDDPLAQRRAMARIRRLIAELANGSADDALMAAIDLGLPVCPVPASAGPPTMAVNPGPGKMAGDIVANPQWTGHAASTSEDGNHPIPASGGAGGEASGELGKSGLPGGGGSGVWTDKER